jgi:hypothetical protein
MFKNPPKILAHKSAIIEKNYVTPEYILNNDNNSVNLFNRYCPHRMYPLAESGEMIDEITCKFHNFKWSKQGVPINNHRKIVCGVANIGKSGLIFKDFTEPSHAWVDDLAAETELIYSHTIHGVSKASWLWAMEIQVDLLHIWEDGIHPGLTAITDLKDVELIEGDGWVLQTCSTGWWLCIYPYTFVEWSKGCLAITTAIPKDPNIEFEFDWTSQFYYDPTTSNNRRADFEKYFQDVFLEDLQAIERQKGKWFPITKSYSNLEDHCVHFGKWVNLYKLK